MMRVVIIITTALIMALSFSVASGEWEAGPGAQAIAIDGLGNVYVTGASKGSGTNYDYATIIYDIDWPQFHADPAYSGLNPTEEILRSPRVSCLQEAWTIPSGDTIKIGVMESFSGVSAVMGEWCWVIAQWVAHDINKRGGVLVDGKHKRIQVIKGDTQGKVVTSRKGNIMGAG